MSFVKILKLNQLNLRERKVTNITEENITKLSSYNFLIKALEQYNNKNFKNNEMVTEFIKINLPYFEDEAKKQWFDGIEYEGNTYKAWFATVGGMKQEKYGICETIFIREDYTVFAELVEQLISLGKFSELEKIEKEICINKDVLSRLSLITSDLITEIDMPNFIVLPQATYHIIKDYKTVEPFTYKVENKNNEMIDKIDYNLVDVHFDGEIDIFDGGAIATPKVFEEIGNSLNRKDIEFAIIRGYGTGIKGLITKFDIIRYLDVMYKEDTEYCRKTDKGYELKDVWKKWQVVTENTMLLNESMVKLAKYFTSMQEINDLMKKLNNEEFGKYFDLLNKLYITKVNKPSDKITDYRRSNYQLINALGLTPNQYSKLIKQDLKLFKKILKPYSLEKDTTEFVVCTDYINLFYKQCISTDISEEDEYFGEKVQEQLENVVEKVHELINVNPDFVKLDYVKRNLRKLIEKKVRELACGKITIKSKCQYIAVDPISYMNYAMTRNQGENGLKEDEFYSFDCKNDDIRTIQRNPLAAYSEVHNVKFVRNNFYDNWLSTCRELIYFNQKSDILSLLSSADCDGDFVTTIDDEIIKDAVITPTDNKYFITKNDGEKVTLQYNKENRFISTYRASGNLIGSIAIKSASVNCNCQVVPDCYNTISKTFINYMDYLSEMETKNNYTKEQVDELIDTKLSSGEWIKGFSKQCDDELFEYIKQKYYKFEKEIYILLYNSMCAIDAPKTLKFLGKEYMEVINSIYHHKVNFLQYKEKKEDVNLDTYFGRKNNLLDFFSRWIQDNLLNIIENSKPRFSKACTVLQKHLDNNNYCKETLELCKNDINLLYKNYNKARKEAEQVEREANKKLWKERRHYDNELGCWDEFMEQDYLTKREKNKSEKYRQYKDIDKKFIVEANKIIQTFDLDTISKAISDMDKCTENFILSLFFGCLKNKSTRYIYQKSDEGDIEYLYEKYKKIAVTDFDNIKNIEKIIQEDKIKLKLEQKIRLKMSDTSILDDIKQELVNEQSYKLALNDKRIEVFEEFAELLKDKESINIVAFDKKKDGTDSIAKKSFGVIIQL